jgi:hypothetical protein
MPDQTKFEEIFKGLRTILQKHEKNLVVIHNNDKNYYLDTPFSEKWGKALMFGAAHVKKNYVSFYLFPVYMFPDLLDSASPALKKRMQGKSCFNFSTLDDSLLKELEQLTERSIERARQEKLIV